MFAARAASESAEMQSLESCAIRFFVMPALCPFELWLAPGKPRSCPGDTISLERHQAASPGKEARAMR